MRVSKTDVWSVWVNGAKSISQAIPCFWQSTYSCFGFSLANYDVDHCSDCPCGLDWFCSFDTHVEPALLQNLRLNILNMVSWGLHATYLHFEGEHHTNLALVPLIDTDEADFSVTFRASFTQTFSTKTVYPPDSTWLKALISHCLFSQMLIRRKFHWSIFEEAA